MNWYYANEGSACGPVSEGELAGLAASGTVSTETLLWHPGREEWEPAWKLKPEIVPQPSKTAMARQAKGASDRIPVDEGAKAEPSKTQPASAKPESGGVFSRLLGRLKKK